MIRIASPLINVLLSTIVGCASVIQASRPLRAYEPPRDWDAAVYFNFEDSTWSPRAGYATRIEFDDGVRQHVVTARDLFDAPTGEKRTPWYRLQPAKQGRDIVLHVTLQHQNGVQTTADYPLTIQRGEFVTVLAGVYTRDPNEWYISMPPFRKAFSVHPTVQAQPGDSLWIQHAPRGRDCFSCPR